LYEGLEGLTDQDHWLSNEFDLRHQIKTLVTEVLQSSVSSATSGAYYRTYEVQLVGYNPERIGLKLGDRLIDRDLFFGALLELLELE